MSRSCTSDPCVTAHPDRATSRLPRHHRSVHHARSCTIVESTSYPGTTRRFHAGPRSRSGCARERTSTPATAPSASTRKRVGVPQHPEDHRGVNQASAAVLHDFYGAARRTTRPGARASGGELAKLLENTFRHVNIALVNETRVYCHDLAGLTSGRWSSGRNQAFRLHEVHARARSRRALPPIDPSYLTWQAWRSLGPAFPFRRYRQRRQRQHARPCGLPRGRPPQPANAAVNGSRILLVGLADKRNSRDARQSPAHSRQDSPISELICGGSIRSSELRTSPATSGSVPWRVESIADVDLVICSPTTTRSTESSDRTPTGSWTPETASAPLRRAPLVVRRQSVRLTVRSRSAISTAREHVHDPRFSSTGHRGRAQTRSTRL